jgi:hypothetical protein
MLTAMSVHSVPEWVDFLVRAAQHAPSADNSQPWRLDWDGSRLSVRIDPVRASAGLGLDHPANLMAMGALVENLAQAIAALGLPPDALTPGPGGAREPFATITWNRSVPPPGNESATPLFRRHTNRGPYQTDPLDPALLGRVAAMTEGPLRTLVVSDRTQMKRLAGLLRAASEVRFQTEEIHRWLGTSLRFAPEAVDRGDGLDIATLLLPPGATGLLKLSLDWRRMSLLNRFGAFKLFAFLEAAMLQQSAALLLVAGPARQTGIEVAAGRLLERVWIELNHQGVAVHPYFVLSDQLHRLRTARVADPFVASVNAVAAGTAEFLESAENTVFMLLRTGFPKIEDPVRSRRLPAAATFSASNE